MLMEYQDAVNLVSHVIEQANKDAYNAALTKPGSCTIEHHRHSVRVCAREFLAQLEPRKTEHLAPVDWAIAVMEVIG